MIRNYFKTAFRTLVKNRSYAAINIAGLAISLTAAMLLLMWVWDEMSYDNMHGKGDRIYSANGAIDREMNNIWSTSAPLAVFGKAEIPAIEDACRVNEWGGTMLFEYGGNKFSEATAYADSTFFRLFDFKLLEGNPQQPFKDNRSVILNQTTAKKYFGEAAAMGKVLQVKRGERMESFTVTGIMEDMPANSSMRYNLLLPFGMLGENYDRDNDWGNFGYRTYFLLKPGAEPQTVGKQLAELHLKHRPSEFFKDINYLMQPLGKLHLYNAKGEEQGMKQVKIFTLVAMVILLIACINYVNLVTARSSRRSKEVSVRKVVGANKGHLFWQFITESFLVFFISLIIAVGLIMVLMPFYNTLSGKEMVFSLSDGRVWAIFGLSLLAVLSLAGIYPAMALSTFNPALALKGILPGFGKNSSFRKVLVVVQFSCSVVLIVATLVISNQLKYIRNMDLGYAKENIFTFSTYNFQQHYETIKSGLEQEPGILGVTIAGQSILDVGSATGDIEWEGKPADMQNFMINQLSVDRSFPEVMDMEYVEGDGFTGTAADSAHYILNEMAIRQMGITDPIGKTITFHDEPGTIVAVVKDFHFKDMKTAIEPCILFMAPQWGWNTMYVKTTGNDAQKAIASVEKRWKQYNADYEFNYRFMDEAFDNMYRSDTRSGILFNIFAGIAIVLSCLGLFGLVTFTAETKFKEIGIRKTLGASVGNIIMLISKEFLKLVGISFLIAIPLAWWMMNRWLENYAYRTDITWWIFAVAGITAFAIAAITVCGKSIRAAQQNPIKAIRME